jgi:GABA(A) receptor-associated protein
MYASLRIRASAESPSRCLFLADVYLRPILAALMSDIYAKYKDEDGFLYITYSGESTFGSL